MGAIAQPRTDYSVLVVDDSRLTRILIRRYLDRAGYSVLEAETAAEALRLYEQKRPAIVTIDLGLGDDRGEDLISRLRTADPDVRLVVVTADSDPVHRDRLLRSGAMGMVLKPLTGSQDLLSEVAAALGNRWASAGLLAAAQRVGQDVLETTLGVPETEQPADESAVSTGEPLVAVSRLDGAYQGALRVRCDRRLAQALACRMFGVDGADVSAEDLADAVTEVSNILVGNLKGTVPGACSHSVPVIVDDDEPAGLEAAEAGAETVLVPTAHGDLLLSYLPGA